MLYLNNFCANKHQNFKNMNMSGFLFLYIGQFMKETVIPSTFTEYWDYAGQGSVCCDPCPQGVPRPDKTEPHLSGATRPPGEKREPREPWVVGAGSTGSLTERGHLPGVLSGSGSPSNEASGDVLIRKEV